MRLLFAATIAVKCNRVAPRDGTVVHAPARGRITGDGALSCAQRMPMHRPPSCALGPRGGGALTLGATRSTRCGEVQVDHKRPNPRRFAVGGDGRGLGCPGTRKTVTGGPAGGGGR